ncbi:sulfatase-like hydrolase/transferase [Paraflavisolibacter sp. H34]|uniref:sulfatase-like hydrolase/transferase n=1 Tax=Huijunlia imazamoxiresistens TaxID=3127457 RepID=UPI00301A0200
MRTALFNFSVPPEKTNLIAKTVLLCFLVYYPALFSLFYTAIISPPAGGVISWVTFNELVTVFLTLSILLLISTLLRIHWLHRFYLIGMMTGVYLKALLETSYFYMYHHTISSSTIYILLETNFSEARDYFSMYFDGPLLVIWLVLLMPLLLAVFLLTRGFPRKRSPFNLASLLKNHKVLPYLVSVSLIVLFSAICIYTESYRRDVLYVAYQSFKAYKKEALSFQLLGKDKFGGKFTNVSSDDQQEELYVLIIGESTCRHHMSLYNYYRNTNPLLQSRRNELTVYNDVISPHAHTIPSLQKVLTLANYEHPERSKDGSLLQLMNKAGFTTYWISNQAPIGMYETLVTTIAKAAHTSYFINTGDFSFNATVDESLLVPYDEKLLVPLTQVLSQKAKKKFIALHLMGTHGVYLYRYPAAFDRFHTEPNTPFQHETAFKAINEYDNAVLYNDFVVNKVIDLIKKEDKKSWVIYLSDHGEDAYETSNAADHEEGKGTKPMYDIPFFIWLSPKYQQADAHHQYDVNRKYMSDDLIYTIADLSNVRFTEFDAARSLVHPNFVERKRLIGKGEEYDKKFSGN